MFLIKTLNTSKVNIEHQRFGGIKIVCKLGVEIAKKFYPFLTIQFMKSDERELISGLLAGNPDDFQRLVKLYWDAMFKTAYRITGNKDDAEDITQEVFAELWVRRDSLGTVRTSLAGWLLSKTSSRTLNYLHSRRTKGLRLDEYFRLLEVSSGGDDNAHSIKLEAAISALPQRQQQVYRLAKLDGIPHATISEMLDLSIKSIKVTVKIANDKVLKFVKGGSTIGLLVFFLNGVTVIF